VLLLSDPYSLQRNNKTPATIRHLKVVYEGLLQNTSCQNTMLRVYNKDNLITLGYLRTPMKKNSNTFASSMSDSVVATVPIISLSLY
jgi:hypothetical protein